MRVTARSLKRAKGHAQMSSNRLTHLLIALLVASGVGTAVARAATPRLTAPPIITFDRSHPSDGVTVYLRLDRPAPRRAHGTGAALLRISIANPGRPDALKQAAAVGRPTRRCYSARVFTEEGAPAHPRTGMRVKVIVDIGSRAAPQRRTITVRLQGVGHLGPRASDDPALQELGCVNGPPT
jgi:hypothetical protein